MKNNNTDEVSANENATVALQRKLRDIEFAIPEALELLNLSTLKIYEKYKYTKWSEMPEIVGSYLIERYDFCFVDTIIGFYKGNKKIAFRNECLGKTFERYNMQHAPEIRKTLTDLTQEQLSEMIEVMIETLNKKKEREAVSCATE